MSNDTENTDTQQFDTDAIIDLFAALVEADHSWAKHIADHGLDPEKVIQRALPAIFGRSDGQINIAGKAFCLGLQFGAMRLTPLPYEEEPCECFACTLRRARTESNDSDVD